jgi:hypothetical protein
MKAPGKEDQLYRVAGGEPGVPARLDGRGARLSIATITQPKLLECFHRERLYLRRCGEWNETTVGESAGSCQRYIEDFQVCGKPNLLRVSWDVGAEEFVIEAELE